MENQYEKFSRDMKAAGRTVKPYRGRNFFDGPAVVIPRDELQKVIRETSVDVQTDSLGRENLLVYPKFMFGADSQVAAANPSDRG